MTRKRQEPVHGESMVSLRSSSVHLFSTVDIQIRILAPCLETGRPCCELLFILVRSSITKPDTVFPFCTWLPIGVLAYLLVIELGRTMTGGQLVVTAWDWLLSFRVSYLIFVFSQKTTISFRVKNTSGCYTKGKFHIWYVIYILYFWWIGERDTEIN